MKIQLIYAKKEKTQSEKPKKKPCLAPFRDISNNAKIKRFQSLFDDVVKLAEENKAFSYMEDIAIDDM